MTSNLADVFNRKAAAPRTGNRHGGPREAPYNVYPASDGYVAIISVNESHWIGLTRAMGRPELAEDPRLKTVLDRLKHIDLTDQIVSEWSSWLTRNEIAEICRAHRVPCAAVRDLLEVTEDDHLHARGMLRGNRASGVRRHPGSSQPAGTPRCRGAGIHPVCAARSAQ